MTHPQSIHDLDIEKAAPLAAIWWRSARNDWPLSRALLIWLIYEVDPPTIYNGDNPSDVSAFDRLYDAASKFTKKLYAMPCPEHGSHPSWIHGIRDGEIQFRCSASRHDFAHTLEAVLSYKGV